MSVERQQGRPTAEYFTESALRFLRDEYYWVNPFKGVYEYDHSKRALDIGVIWREYQADGRVPSDSFDLEFFCSSSTSALSSKRKACDINVSVEHCNPLPSAL